MLATIRRLQQIWRAQTIRFGGAVVGHSCRIEETVRVSLGYGRNGRGQVSIGERCTLAQGAVLAAWGGSITIANDVFLGPYVVIYGQGGVEIGANSLVAMHCRVVSSDHTVPGRGVLIRSQPNQLSRTTIGSDVWLGAGVSVLKGVRIGDGCVVGAGAVVTESLPDYAVAVGVPARVVGSRS